jgi:2-polyprenyl-6-methoxyphenol hydroxylase-like FAD-dependent oxidoreductase
MNVHVIGGGPAGLYFAILMKKAWPQTRITVFERNKPDDTFGFGVVFSDQTLAAFESYDRETYRADRRPLRLLGRHRDPFPRHDAPHRRQRLLRQLARPCC